MTRRARLLVFAMLALLLVWALSACDDTTPVIAGTPTPTASPTPVPETFTASITGSPLPADALGRIIDGDDHYYQYLSFGALRVYEYGTGTFLDGVLVNGYPDALEGSIRILFYDKDDRLCGMGDLHNAEGGTRYQSGSNAVYAEIAADVDVRLLDFVLEVRTAFTPVPREG